MHRGDIYLVDFEPAFGAEADKERPAVIVSNEGANRNVKRRQWGVVIVVPLTTNLTDIPPFQVLIPAEQSGLDEDSKAQTEQIRAVSFGRLQERLGQIPPLLMVQLDHALRRQLVL